MPIVCAAASCIYSSELENTSNVVFISFPNDYMAKLWAYNCGRQDLMTKSNQELHLNYYVCSHHIDDKYFISKSNPIIIKQGAVPTLFAGHTSEKDNAIDLFSNHTQTVQIPNEPFNFCDIRVQIDHCQDLSINFTNLCRICGCVVSEGIEIFGPKGIKSRLKEKMTLHMPILITQEDLLPQQLCANCHHKLEDAHSLVVTCIQTDLRFRKLLNVQEAPEYDARFGGILQECSLAEVNGLCVNGIIPNESLTFITVKDAGNTQEIVVPETEPKMITTDFQNVEIVDTINIAPNNIDGIHLDTAENNEAQSLCNIVEKFVENETGSNEFALNIELETSASKEMENKNLEKEEFPANVPEDSVKGENHGNGRKELKNILIICINCKSYIKTSKDDESKGTESTKIDDEFQALSLYDTSSCDLEKCQLCSRMFSKEDMYVYKCRKRCGRCEATFQAKKELQKHIIDNHNGVMLYKCFLCEKTYEKWSSLDVHEATHRSDKPFFCNICGKGFKHSNNLRGHRRTHLEESKKKRHVCEECGKGFRSKFHLREHMNQHSDDKPYPCDECGKSFHKRIQLRQHKLSHGTKKYSCPLCNMSFNRKGNMNSHIKRHTNVGLYTCRVCTSKFKSMSELRKHREKHSQYEIIESIKKSSPTKKIWECTVCSKIFPIRSALEQHERVHNENKAVIECNECDKKLSSKHSLKYHKRALHSKIRPFACSYCNESFVSKESRMIHERKHTGILPYVCTICDQQYRCSSSLNQHMKVHVDVRPFKCNSCDKTFKRKGALIVHERIHTGEKPFSCSHCEKSFTQKNDMLKHVKTHRKESTECSNCDRGFNDTEELDKHCSMHRENAAEDSSVLQKERQEGTI